MNEVLCYVVLPKCDPVNNAVIHPCRELCQDMKDGCLDIFISLLRKASSVKENLLVDWKVLAKREPSTWFNCNYLPSRYGSIPCFYTPVTCDAPPNVTNAVVVQYNRTHEAKTQTEYSCDSDKFQMEGNSTVTCLYSGQWSEPPQCVKTVKNGIPLMIVLPVLIILVVLYLVIVIALICRQKTKSNLKRNKKYDAFVCYAFDADNEFVMTSIQPELEEKCIPPFKLCMHERDLDPGRQILENIQEAIEDSNSAIMIISQDFINSIWCKEEFTHCYIEHMKDPAFRLFVIMMQPPDTLMNMSKHMTKFITQKTYLDKDDPNLIEKILRYLKWVKQPKNENKHEDKENESEEAERFIK